MTDTPAAVIRNISWMSINGIAGYWDGSGGKNPGENPAGQDHTERNPTGRNHTEDNHIRDKTTQHEMCTKSLNNMKCRQINSKIF